MFASIISVTTIESGVSAIGMLKRLKWKEEKKKLKTVKITKEKRDNEFCKK